MISHLNEKGTQIQSYERFRIYFLLKMSRGPVTVRALTAHQIATDNHAMVTHEEHVLL